MTSKMTKLLMGAGVLALTSAGTAHAAGTEAGTVVQNTFTLDYQVGGVPQTQIEPAPGDETTFSVDRIIDLDVVANPVTQTVAPGQTGVVQSFTVTNDGNGFQAYDLDLIQGTDGTDDNFDTTFAPTDVTYTLYTPDPGVTTGATPGFAASTFVYDGSTSPDVAPDGYIVVEVTMAVPAGEDDGNEADLVLLAETLEPTAANANGVPGTPGAAVTQNTGANGEDTVETIFNDPLGTTGVTNVADDATDPDGSGSALSTVVVTAADITAVKTVALVDPDPANDGACTFASTPTPASPVSGDFYLPGACVEYTITVTNAGGADATDVDVADTLAAELDFIAVSNSMGGTNTVDSTAPAAKTCDGVNCVVEVAGGTVAAQVGTTATTETVLIRARIK